MLNFKYKLITIFIVFGYFMLVISKTGPSHDKVVVCYISTWAVYRPSKGSYSIDHLDPNLCTHVVYAFAGLNATTDEIKSLDPWQDLKDNYGKGGYERITHLRQTHPHLKISIAIGGWNEGSKNYSRMAADPGRRKHFVQSALDFVLKYKFDGLDLDWEYPTQRGGEPYDKQNFVHLVKELRESFWPHKLLVTSAFGASKEVIDKGYDIRQLSKYLDFLHIMCYDYGGAWDKRITANAPLNDQGANNIKFTIDYLIKLGASPSKIVMGIPFYGRTFITKHKGNFEDASNDVGFQGIYTRENGFMGYNEICQLVSNKSSGWTLNWNSERNQALARFKDEETDETRVVVFDSTRSVANKMRYAMQRGLGGAMVWSIDTDDFLGDCSTDIDTFADFKPGPGITLTIPKRYNANYPLLRTVNEGIVIALDEISLEADIKEKEKENEIPHGKDDEKGIASRSILSFSLAIIASFVVFEVL